MLGLRPDFPSGVDSGVSHRLNVIRARHGTTETGDTVERLGVLGLGRMGLPIARRLLAAGYPVTAFDPDAERLALAVRAGAETAADERGVAERADVLVTVLPGPAELEAAMLGSGAALEGMGAGSCWLDLTSNDPAVATRVAERAAARSVASVGAPMGGGPAEAAGGALRFYVGGAETAVERVEPLLAALGDSTDRLRTGTDAASAHTTKLLVNTLWFGQVVAVTEVLLLGQSLGLGLSGLRDALATGPGGSAFITNHLGALLRGDYLESFGLSRVVDELKTVTALADGVDSPAELTGLVTRLHADALSRFGPVDGELLAARLLEERAGRTVRLAPES